MKAGGATSVDTASLPSAAASAAEQMADWPTAWAGDLTPIRKPDWNYARAAHLLQRAGFGGTPEEIAHLASMAPEQAVNYLIDYETIDVSHLPVFEASAIYLHGYKYASIYKVFEDTQATGKALGVSKLAAPPLDYQPPVDEYYTLLWSERGEMRRASQWWADRMLITPRPLQENLALFWHNHFATSQEKVMSFGFMLGQIEMLRQRANGNLRDLLIGIAQDPAMLIWLDNKDNVKGKPNENFAREVMELFSMGEGQGYAEKDIREMARAFTGWTLTSDETADQPGHFVDDPAKHDEGIKSFLGATGAFNGYDAIDIILQQPAVPLFITRKLYRYFVREEISSEFNDQLARLLVDSKYEVKPVLKTMFLSRDFYSAKSFGAQIKSPVALLVSTYRKLGLTSIPGIPDFNETTAALGQILFFPPNVAGWAGARTWINPATLLARCNCIESLLFPDPVNFVDPHKEISESFRRIPLKYTDYNIIGHIWDPKTETMEPVPLAVYDRYLSGMTLEEARQVPMDDAKAGAAPMSTSMSASKEQPKSRMGAISNNERYNLAVGVYTGAWQANVRVKPIRRTLAQIDFIAMVREAGGVTAQDAVDCFCRRFLNVSLNDERKGAVLSFLRSALKSDKLDYASPNLELALRRTVHLILSAPEYQLA